MQNVFRGVGWMDSTTTMRIAMQNGADLNTKISWMGFRCAQSVDSQLQASTKVSGHGPMTSNERIST